MNEPIILVEDQERPLIWIEPEGLDVERLARAICANREPIMHAGSEMFVDDECRGFARKVAADYARLGANE